MKQFFLYPWRSFGNDFESRPQGNIEFDEQQSLVGPTVKKSIIPIISRKKRLRSVDSFCITTQTAARPGRGRWHNNQTLQKYSRHSVDATHARHIFPASSHHSSTWAAWDCEGSAARCLKKPLALPTVAWWPQIFPPFLPGPGQPQTPGAAARR